MQTLSEILKCTETFEKLMRSSDEEIITPTLKRPDYTRFQQVRSHTLMLIHGY